MGLYPENSESAAPPEAEQRAPAYGWWILHSASQQDGHHTMVFLLFFMLSFHISFTMKLKAEHWVRTS